MSRRLSISASRTLYDKLTRVQAFHAQTRLRESAVAQSFHPGDNLVFQLESGYGLLRVLAVDEDVDGTRTWHLLAFEELFPDVEAAEVALAAPENLHASIKHMALTDRAFERTPAARLGNHPVTEDELAAYRQWKKDNGQVSDRSALLMLGLR